MLRLSVFDGSADVEAPRGIAICGSSAPNDTTWPCPPPSGVKASSSAELARRTRAAHRWQPFRRSSHFGSHIRPVSWGGVR